jgi:uncharacterized protein (TIGR02145 family)
MRKPLIILFICLSVIGNAQSLFFEQNGDIDCTIGGNGYLYNFYAVSNVNFAPTGWHVATGGDASALEAYTSDNSGLLKMTGNCKWVAPNTGATNIYGFSAFGSGYRYNGVSTDYSLINYYSFFWTSTENPSGYYYYMRFAYNSTDLIVTTWTYPKTGYSVRLVKNNSTDPGTLTDYDSNVYTTVKIDTTVWIVENWKCTHLNDGTDIPEVTDFNTWKALTTGARCVYNNNEGYK